MKAIHFVAFILLVVGGLNWLLVGVWGWDISRWLGGMDSTLVKAVYILVGLSAVFELVTHSRGCKTCKKDNMDSM
ncbi:MAG: DUF378 domain-containing protein [bacterium]|nr:DUF378 domain-containing protein [bacterium]